MNIQPIILAAGQGTRMKSALPKVLHPIMEKPMIRYILEETAKVTDLTPVVVIGHGAEMVQQAISDLCNTAVQKRQLGTADAVQAAESSASGKAEMTLVAYGDMPCLTAGTIRHLCETQEQNPGVFSMLTIIQDDSHGFGRIIRKEDGSVSAIVEEAQATPAQLQLKECNVGLYCFRSEWLWNALKRVKISPKGEYYLTDLVELANEDNQQVKAVILTDPEEALGVNNRLHLAEAETILRRRINRYWMIEGVTMIDPDATYIGHHVMLGQDITIYPNTHISGNSVIGNGAILGPLSVIDNSRIGAESILPQATIRNAVIPEHTNLKPGQTIEG